MELLDLASASVAVLSEPAQIDAVCSRTDLEILAAFRPGPRTVTVAAREHGLDPDRFRHRVKRMQRLGLLVVDRTEQRAGRPMPVFRLVADEFYVPLRLLDAERDVFAKIKDWTDVLIANASRVLARSAIELGMSGLRVAWVDGLGFRRETAAEPGVSWESSQFAGPAVLMRWASLRLAPPEARALRDDLLALLGEYTDRQSAGGVPHVLGLGLSPVVDGGPDPIR
ncbi:MAG: winged helix-turn-helix domain-containing protein [Phycicoccus sp.]